MNNLDPEVAERPARPDRLRRAAARRRATGPRCSRSWNACATLENDETLLVQSGKPVGVFKHARRRAPRAARQLAILCPPGPPARSSPSWKPQGLTMYGQMTAGSWIYIGTQGILQGTYETFAQAARKHFGPDATWRASWC